MSDLNAMLSDFVDINSMIDEVSKSEKKTNFWRPTKQKTTVRILPPIKANGERLPYFEHRVHWVNGQPYECLNQTVVDKNGSMHTACECPLCKMAKTLYNTKTDEAVDLAKKISGKTRYVVRLIVRDDPEHATEPVFYELPFSIYEKVKNAILSKEWGSLIGPLDGRDFDIIKSGEGMYTNYDASSFKPITSRIADDDRKIVEILTKAKDMSYNSLINFKTVEDMKAVAMENDRLARFFGNQPRPTRVVEQFTRDYTNPQAISVVSSSVSDSAPLSEDAVPAYTLEPETKPQAKESASEELDSLLAGLI